MAIKIDLWLKKWNYNPKFDATVDFSSFDKFIDTLWDTLKNNLK